MEARFNLKTQSRDQDCGVKSASRDQSSGKGGPWLEGTKFQLGEIYDKHARHISI